MFWPQSGANSHLLIFDFRKASALWTLWYESKYESDFQLDISYQMYLSFPRSCILIPSNVNANMFNSIVLSMFPYSLLLIALCHFTPSIPFPLIPQNACWGHIWKGGGESYLTRLYRCWGKRRQRILKGFLSLLHFCSWTIGYIGRSPRLLASWVGPRCPNHRRARAVSPWCLCQPGSRGHWTQSANVLSSLVDINFFLCFWAKGGNDGGF